MRRASAKRPLPPSSSSFPHPPRGAARHLCGCLLLAAAAAASAVRRRPAFHPPSTPAPFSATANFRMRASSSIAAAAGMDSGFRTPVLPDALPPALRIKHADPLVLLGSCFSDNIGSRLLSLKYTVDINPMGISYNPLSLQRCLLRLLEGRPFEEGELGRHPQSGLYYSFDHHTSFSHADPRAALEGINARLQTGRNALLRAKHVFLTLGTAHAYECEGGRVVANCHRLPQATFGRRLLGVHEIVAALDDALQRLRAANPAVAVTLTVSPVRHLRNAQGPVANGRSKAHLLTAVHDLIDRSCTPPSGDGRSTVLVVVVVVVVVVVAL